MKDQKEPYLSMEVFAGAMAGFSQVLVTNPCEVVKINLQIQGQLLRQDLSPTARPSATQIIRQLGLRRLFVGSSVCLLRDVPFSIIYFTAYPRLKRILSSEDGSTSKSGLLLAGAAAGVPSAALTTPADVIKTRIQAGINPTLKSRGISSVTLDIWTKEGPMAFFKGTWARMLRSGLQFGVTLFVYELLQNVTVS